MELGADLALQEGGATETVPKTAPAATPWLVQTVACSLALSSLSFSFGLCSYLVVYVQVASCRRLMTPLAVSVLLARVSVAVAVALAVTFAMAGESTLCPLS